MNSRYSRTFLAIDYGKRRIGLAKSDPLGIIASPLETIEVTSRKDAVRKIVRVIEKSEVDQIIIGYPVLASGDKSAMCVEIDKFLDELAKEWSGPAVKIDEDYSSVEAGELIRSTGKRVGKDKGKIDRMAALVILRRYLEEHPKK